MKVLFCAGTLGDNLTVVWADIIQVSRIAGVLWVLYFFLTMFTVLNMLIGVLCEVVAAVSAASKEEMLVDQVRETLLEVLAEFDTDGNGTVSENEFARFCGDPKARQAFADLDVDIGEFEKLT